MTIEIPDLFHVGRLAEYGISHLSDNVILLQYLRAESRLLRTVTVLKSRASAHEPEIRQFQITPEGIVLGDRSPARLVSLASGQKKEGPLVRAFSPRAKCCERDLRVNQLAHLLHHDLAGGDLRRVRECLPPAAAHAPSWWLLGLLVGVLGRVEEAD